MCAHVCSMCAPCVTPIDSLVFARATLSWGRGPAVHLNATTGWPTMLLPGQRLGKLLARNVQENIPRGVYTVTYDGDGVLDFGMDATVVGRGKLRLVAPVVVLVTAGLFCCVAVLSVSVAIFHGRYW